MLRGLTPDLASHDVWETIAREAARESPLWAAALLPPDERQEIAVFSPLGDQRFALGLETIYEGYLLHYGSSRLFAPPDAESTVLLGDYLYAHGLVRIAELGDVEVVADLAELISLCAQLRADRPTTGRGEGGAWAASASLLGSGDPRLAGARAALRDDGDGAPLLRLAEEEAGEQAVARALSLHRERVRSPE